MNLIVILAKEELEKEGKAFNFKVKLLMMENYTGHTSGMTEQGYAFVSFKEVENILEESRNLE